MLFVISFQDHLESLVKNALDLKGPNEKKPIDLTGVNFQFTHALLWSAMAILNIPTLIAWAQNGGKTPGGGTQFERDPSLIPSTILSLCFPLLWGDSYPNKRYFFSINQFAERWRNAVKNYISFLFILLFFINNILLFLGSNITTV